MQPLTDGVKFKLFQMVLLLRTMDARWATFDLRCATLDLSGHIFNFSELKEAALPDPNNVSGLQPEGAYLVLYHHKDPATQPSFVARTVYKPTLRAAQDAVTETFSHDRTIVSARVYRLWKGELNKVADAVRAPAWTYY